MTISVGDIIVFGEGSGHVGLICDVDDVHQIFRYYHATSGSEASRAFKLSIYNTFEKIVSQGGEIYSPPWEQIGMTHNREDFITRVLRVAKVMHTINATYGYSAAVRLFVGQSLLKEDGRNRINLYKARFRHLVHYRGIDFLKPKRNEPVFIQTLTCVSAVLLCYQIAFNADTDHPLLFPLLDPEHTMPKTLRGWLRSNWMNVTPSHTTSWQKESESPSCTNCHIDFSFFLRRHHCRGCGMIFCDTCAPMRIEKNSLRYCIFCN